MRSPEGGCGEDEGCPFDEDGKGGKAVVLETSKGNFRKAAMGLWGSQQRGHEYSEKSGASSISHGLIVRKPWQRRKILPEQERKRWPTEKLIRNPKQ